jgi:hypothetical protein
MISSERTAEIFKAMLLHYDTNNTYDYFKYNGRLKAQPKDVPRQFHRIAERLDNPANVENFFVANISDMYTSHTGLQSNINLYTNKDCYECLKHWENFNSNFNKHFIGYAKNKTRLKFLIEPALNGLPPIVFDTIQRKIPVDIISNLLYNFKTLEDKWKTNDPLIQDLLSFSKHHMFVLEKKQKMSRNLSEIVSNLDK